MIRGATGERILLPAKKRAKNLASGKLFPGGFKEWKVIRDGNMLLGKGEDLSRKEKKLGRDMRSGILTEEVTRRRGLIRARHAGHKSARRKVGSTRHLEGKT